LRRYLPRHNCSEARPQPLPPGSELVLRCPALPDWLGETTVTGLQVGEASLNLHFRRSGTAAHVKISGQRGKLRVRVE